MADVEPISTGPLGQAMALIDETNRNPMIDRVINNSSGGAVDILYHLGLDTSMDLTEFRDVRFVYSRQ